MAKNYPCPRRDESLAETHFGTSVPDPYRWLEDPDSEETQGFVKAQNEISQPYLASCPVRNKFHARSEMNAIVEWEMITIYYTRNWHTN